MDSMIKSDSITQARLAEIYPELARRWMQADQMLSSLGFTIRISQGLRTWPQQDTLYQQGRTTPGSIVTHAKAGESYHNYGLAIDFVPIENAEAIWDQTHPAYMKTIEIGESLGLVSGSNWPPPKTDFPHFQLTGRYPENAPDSNCKYLFNEGGLAAVWKDVDTALGIT